MAFIENDFIAGLPELTWRGLKAPADTGSFEVRHRQAARPYPYVGGEGHDNTGREAIPMTATLYFLDSLMDDPVAGWNKWAPELFDGAAGELKHPILGPKLARVLTFRANVSARVRNGFAVDVTWVETLEDPSNGMFVWLLADAEGGGLAATATAADTAAAALGVQFPGGVGPSGTATALGVPSSAGGPSGAINYGVLPKLPNGKPVLSLSEAVAVIQGAKFATEAALEAYAKQVLFYTELMLDEMERIQHPRAWAGIDLLQRVWLGVQFIAQGAARLVPRATARRTLTVDTTLEKFAAEVDNTISDIASLNPFALRVQIIPRGSTLTYFKA
jgi:hypothetical protein